MHAAATTAVAISVVLIMALSALYYSQNTSSFGNPGNLTLTQSSQSGIPTGCSNLDSSTRSGTPRVVGTIDVGLGSTGVAVDPDVHTVYVLSGNGTVAINDTTDKVIRRLNLGSNQTVPQALTVNPSTGVLYVAATIVAPENLGGPKGIVEVFEPGSNTVHRTISIGTGSNAIAVNPQTGYIFVNNFVSGTVLVISSQNESVVKQISVGGNAEGIAIDPVRNVVLAASSGLSISVINGSTFKVMTSFAVNGQPNGAAVNPVTGRLYVDSFFSREIIVLNSLTGENVTQVRLDSTTDFPEGIAVNPTTDTVYVANRDCNSIAVIDGKTNLLEYYVPVGGFPQGLAFDASNEKLYVASACLSCSGRSVYVISTTS